MRIKATPISDALRAMAPDPALHLREVPLPPAIDGRLRKGQRFVARIGGHEYSVLLSHDKLGDGSERWHISVAGEQVVPKWAHLVAIAHRLKPSVFWVVGIPPEDCWLNLHSNCLHCIEIDDEALVANWRLNARAGDAPT